MRPLGGFVWDSETGSVRNATGLTNWLDWLKAADKWPGVDLFFDLQEAEELFAAGDAAYLVSGPWSLSRLDESLGRDGFRVVPLPGGNFGPGSPMLRVRASMINVNANQAETETALAFAQFLNLNESQQRLLDTQHHVSASVTVDLSEFPNLTGFREQARLATMMSEDTAFRRMEALGDDLYRAVLIDGAESAAAVARFVEAVSIVNQAEPTREVEGRGGDTGAGPVDAVEESEH
jgi:maltose-binding protein MalE